jgi:integrase
MRRTKSGLPKHCTWAVDRHGKRRVRFFKGRFSTYLKGIPWSEPFMRAYAAALEGVKVEQLDPGPRTVPGSFDALCVAYYQSAAFSDLRPSTQTVRRHIIEAFRRQHGTKPLRGLTRAHIHGIVSAKSATPAAANNLLKTLKVMLGFAVEIGLIDSNPTIGIKKYKSHGDGIHSWSEAEVERFRERHPSGTKARLALELLLGTAQRRSDAVKLGRQNVRDDCLVLRQEKTNQPLLIPMHPDLVAELKQAQGTHLTFLTTANGAPFSSNAFSLWFRARCNEAGLPQCSAHGLRKLAATRLAEAGCSASEIAAVTGHKTLREVARYTKAADQAKLARQSLAKQLKAEEQNATKSYPTTPPGWIKNGK